MPKPAAKPDIPPCYAMTPPGLESVAADEIARDLGGEVKKAGQGIVIFRVKQITAELLRLRTVEDVFLLAWGTDALNFRADDLDKIRKWTAKEADWEQLLRLHHQVRPKPAGKPTWHAVTQMTGEHGYRRTDARAAFLQGMRGRFPSSWRLVDEGAAVEFWLTIQGRTAICGLRLSDSTMRHRTYKVEHRPASLRPVVAAAMARLGGASPAAVVLDPMCGGGTTLAEQLLLARQRQFVVTVVGGDMEWSAVAAAGVNLRRVGPARLARWDARRLPLQAVSVDRVLCNPPFGVQLSDPAEIPPLYRRLVAECDRVLKPGGRAVLLVSEADALHAPAVAAGWVLQRQLRVRLLGRPTTLGVWRKPG